MWDEKTQELKERIGRLSDDELLKMVEVDLDDYRKEAIDVAKGELMARGIKFEDPSIENSRNKQIEEWAASAIKRAPNCVTCGTQTRPGLLLGEKEITIMFSDKDEQRFVEAYACANCGRVQMVVDFETDVDEGPTGTVA